MASIPVVFSLLSTIRLIIVRTIRSLILGELIYSVGKTEICPGLKILSIMSEIGVASRSKTLEKNLLLTLLTIPS
ncbi:hypothetical protein SDC9_203608 [bioreactor metagenome]|uniref:Uncharacterized protein n=1 Tax=bioreactor metagenome TaxID=1076179 RepID=A0A645J619_9ZZZZ